MTPGFSKLTPVLVGPMIFLSVIISPTVMLRGMGKTFRYDEDHAWCHTVESNLINISKKSARNQVVHVPVILHERASGKQYIAL